MLAGSPVVCPCLPPVAVVAVFLMPGFVLVLFIFVLVFIGRGVCEVGLVLLEGVSICIPAVALLVRLALSVTVSSAVTLHVLAAALHGALDGTTMAPPDKSFPAALGVYGIT